MDRNTHRFTGTRLVSVADHNPDTVRTDAGFEWWYAEARRLEAEEKAKLAAAEAELATVTARPKRRRGRHRAA